MSRVTDMQDSTDGMAAAGEPSAGDEAAFSKLMERYRRELHLHCYRMLASFDDAEDVVQETLLRAWKSRASFQARSSYRAWLYRIATNACLDFIERDSKRGVPRDPILASPLTTEIAWLQPYPDRLLDEIASSGVEPDAAVVAKETIALAFLVAIQLLPPKQRATLILRDVLVWSAKETASVLELSVASVNSALQRARLTLKEHGPTGRAEWAPTADPSAAERALLQRYIDASEGGDAAAFIDVLREDARFSMPPEPGLYVGREVIVRGFVEVGFGSDAFGKVRCVLTRANRQPAVACYLRAPGDAEYRALALDVLRIEEGAIAEIITFFGPNLFAKFDLPPTL